MSHPPRALELLCSPQKGGFVPGFGTELSQKTNTLSAKRTAV